MKSRSCWGKGAVLLFVILLCTACGRKSGRIPAAADPVTSGQYDGWEQVSNAGGMTAEDSTTKQEETTQETTAQQENTAGQKETTQERTTEQESTAKREEVQEKTTAEESTTAQKETTQESTTAQKETTQENTTAVQEETTTAQETTAPTQEVTTTQAPTLSQEEKAALMRQRIAEELPGIVCWGDSLTVGYGGDGESYPAVLERLICERIIDGIPVVNNGVCVEPTYTIMARAGAYPMYVNAFDIPAECYRVQIHLNLEGGQYTNLTSFGDAGLNPVTIAGVKGVLTPDYVENEYGYVEFCRLEPGDPVHVEGMTPVYPASRDLYGGYVNILFMGENGYYTSPEDLISQYRRMIDARGCDRYIIIGLTTGDNSNRGELSDKLEEAFGNHYIDMRTELCNRGPELAGVERKEGDWYNIQEGLVMGYLMSDSIHLNGDGYRAMGMIVYEKMEELGYFNGVKEIIAAYQ